MKIDDPPYLGLEEFLPGSLAGIFLTKPALSFKHLSIEDPRSEWAVTALRKKAAASVRTVAQA